MKGGEPVMSRKILRIFTIIAIGITSFGLLVGGTYLYDRYIYTNPIEEALSQMESIEISQFEENANSIYITAHFNSQEGLQSNFYNLLNKIEEQKNNSVVNYVVNIKNNSNNEEFAKFLKAAKLPIYEAINTGHYTALPQQLTALSQNEEINYDLEIDNNFIFVTINKGEDYAHLVINSEDSPYRIVTTMGEEFV